MSSSSSSICYNNNDDYDGEGSELVIMIIDITTMIIRK